MRLTTAFILFAMMLFYGDICHAKDKGKPDAIQKQYVQQLRSNTDALIVVWSEQERNDIQTETQSQMENLEVSYRGRVPADVKAKGAKLESARDDLKAKESTLNKERESLKMDALKYYRGKLPEWLHKEWNKEDSRYIEELQRRVAEKSKKLGLQ